MPKKKKDNKYYLVIDNIRGHTHGAFEYNKDGYRRAKEYIKQIKRDSKINYQIVEK